MHSELIARLEDATGPERELDAEIALASGQYVYEKRDRDRQEWFYPTNGSRYERCALHYGSTGGTLPRYTASIDAALTLVPEEHREAMHLTWHRCVLPDAMGYGATPALAIVIAVLRAKGDA